MSRSLSDKKSQSSIEFIIIVGAVLLSFVTVLAVLQKSLGEKTIEKRNFEFLELAMAVQNEMNLASKTSDGYQRSFTLPEKIEGFNYQIRIIADSVYLNSTEAEYAVALPSPEVSGQLQKGSNTLRKINGTIYLN